MGPENKNIISENENIISESQIPEGFQEIRVKELVFYICHEDVSILWSYPYAHSYVTDL